jgi:serine/threonine-protein kinase RsbW
MKPQRLLRIEAELKNLAAIRRFVEEAATSLGAGPAAVSAVRLAVDEAATNIISHGYRNQGGSLEINIWSEGDDLLVRLRDEAAPFDPTTVPPPDISLPLEQRPVGGLGIHLMRQAVDEFRHRPIPGGGNELTLVKRGVRK